MGLHAGTTLAQTASAPQAIDIPAGNLAQALDRLGEQTGVLITYEPGLVQGLSAPRVSGQLAPGEALRRLLAGSSIQMEAVNERTFVLRRGPATNPAPPAGSAQQRAPRTAEPEVTELDSILVTGTNLRGVTSIASPITTIGREEIDTLGAGNLHMALRKLPQNFGGGASDQTVPTLAGGGNAVNAIGGAGVNLRGLGSESTLVLMNGHRVAPGNINGNWVDISLFPVAAIERIDVIPDGASATYGSDAVGGVVNFIMRNGFQGAETRASHGLASQGGTHETQLAQTVGGVWNSGSAILSYEYVDRSELIASERDYTAANTGTTLLPDQTRHSLFAAGELQATENFSLFADALYAQRRTSGANLFTSAFTLKQPSTVEVHNFNVGGRYELSDKLGLEASGGYVRNKSRRDAFFGAADALIAASEGTATISTFQTKLDGEVWDGPAGPVNIAIGGQYRKESFRRLNVLSGQSFEPERSVAAGFVEARIPLVGPIDSSSGPSRLEASIASRYERYSDFGSTNNPKIGLIWRPTQDVHLRATYGKSFKAPVLNDLDPVPFEVSAWRQVDPLAGNDLSNVLLIFGGNPELDPERATTWTAGLDIQPRRLPGLRANITYYSIDFRDRITTAQTAGYDILDALRVEAILGPRIVRRNPPLEAVVQAVNSTSNFMDQTGIPGGIDLSMIDVIVDSRWLNLASLKTEGVDFSALYNLPIDGGSIDLGLTGTYILEFDTRFTDTTPVASVLSTPYNPVDLKMQARAVLQRNGLTAAFYVNYVDSYEDRRGGPAVPVKSWTTADAMIGYAFERTSGALRDLSLALIVNNITDEDPPYVATIHPNYPGIVFDGANASAIGRYLSFQLTKRW